MAKELIPLSEVEETRGGTIRAWLESEEIANDLAVSVDGWLTPEAYKQQIMLDLQDDKIRDCHPRSKFAAALKCATLQLLPHLQQVALIPRKIKNPDGQVIRKDVTVMVQWQGYQALMLRHPDVFEIKHALVHVEDTYKYDPITQTLIVHDFDPFNPKRIFRSPEDIRGGYLIISYNDDRPDHWHFVHQDTIKKARNCAETLKVWDMWPEEMATKTLYRNCYSRRIIPMDPMLQQRVERLVKHDDLQMGNNPERLQIDPSRVIEHKPEAPAASRAQQMAERYTEPEVVNPPYEAEELPNEAEDESNAPVDESSEPEAEAKPAQKETKPKSQKGGSKKGQKSLIDEDDRTISKRLLDRIKTAEGDNDLMVIADEAAEWLAQKKLSQAEYEQIIEALNQRQSEI